ncbi:hypothetical protein Q0F98_30475 [Paenibacillus amylolyticus]|nr:hypothetical protein Q0F98_30475 [Paenibacillus amylolyticus]
MPIPWFSELSILFETGKVGDLRERVDEIFELLAAQEGLSPEMLHLYYHAMLHVVYPLLHQKTCQYAVCIRVNGSRKRVW